MDFPQHVFSDKERIIVGCLYLGLSVIILPIHLLFLTLFVIHDDFRRNLAYNIMLSIGVTECLQLIGHIYGGIATLVDNHDYEIIEELTGNITNAAWISLIPQTLILSFNRYTVFRRHKSKHTKLFLFLIACCWLYGCAFFVIYSTPLTGLKYDEKCFCWKYDDGPWSRMIEAAEFYSLAPTLIATFFVYLAIVLNVAYMRTTLTSNKKIYDKNECKILLQSFIMFVYPSLMLLLWHYGGYFLPPSHLIPVGINLLWIIFCGLNPILYFFMNRQIRNRLLQLLHLKKNDKLDDVIILPKSSSETPAKLPHRRITIT